MRGRPLRQTLGFQIAEFLWRATVYAVGFVHIIRWLGGLVGLDG